MYRFLRAHDRLKGLSLATLVEYQQNACPNADTKQKSCCQRAKKPKPTTVICGAGRRPAQSRQTVSSRPH